MLQLNLRLQAACIVACAGAEQAPVVFDAVLALREAGIRCEADRTGRSLKAQFKQADKMGATLCVVIGPDEVEAGAVTLRRHGVSRAGTDTC